MRFYCIRAVKKGEDGNDVYSLPFRYKEAVPYLQVHPKCGAPSDENVAKLKGNEMWRGVASDLETESAVGSTIGKRPNQTNTSEWEETHCHVD